MEFPTSAKELKQLGWDYIDVILISGDAYIDHPSFGIAVIARVLEKHGFRVAIVPQPNWRDDLRDFKKLGEPRLFFGISSGSMDSMVNHYTATRRLRSDDAYTPGGLAGQRPDYATVCYSRILKDLFPDVPIVIGGIEASLRRLTHYDYWSDSLKKSILPDSRADILVYGMGERAIAEIARSLQQGIPVSQLTDIPQTAYVAPNTAGCASAPILLASYEQCLADKRTYAANFRIFEQQSYSRQQEKLAEPCDGKFVVVNEPYPVMTSAEMDEIYGLPFTRLPHSRYAKKPPIPAFEMIKNSVTIHRGCFGACSFCTISAHQGKFIISRSGESILKELRAISAQPDFKGHITDLGGPSANMYRMNGKNAEQCSVCKRPSCLFPVTCKNLNNDHSSLTELYKQASAIPGIKKISIGSGIRLDLLQNSPGERQYTEQLIRNHISGRLKVAPEHTEPDVLDIMRKSGFESFLAFKHTFDSLNESWKLRQQLIPYFISSHPGCTPQHMQRLADKLRHARIMPEQVQDFTPTPMTLATTMYYTGLDPYTMKPVFVAKSKDEKDKQKSYFFWYKKQR